MNFQIDFLSMNISATLMIFVVANIRNLIKNKVPHFLIGLMWFVVIFRLYVPYSFTTNLNIYNLLYYIRKIISEIDVFQIDQKYYYFDRVLKQIWNVKEVQILTFTIWLIGFIFIWRYFLKSYRVAEKIWETAKVSPIEKDIKFYLDNLGLKKDIMIRESSFVTIPVACGIFRRRIILPPNFESCNQKLFKQVLIHECMHLKYWHPLIQHIIVGILCLNWFNPAIWIFYTIARRDLEIACDKHVIEILGEKEKETYAMNLIFIAKSENRDYVFFNGFVKGSAKKVIEERIVAIMKYKKLSTLALVLSMLIPTCIASAMGTNSNYVFGDEVDQKSIEITVGKAAFEKEELEVQYEELEPYIVEIDENVINRLNNIEPNVLAVSKYNVERYERIYTTPAIPSELEVTMKKNGVKYSGTLKLVDMEKSGSKYIGYYSGTLYRV